MNGFESADRYITTQVPFEHTADFWHLVEEKDVKTVLVLQNEVLKYICTLGRTVTELKIKLNFLLFTPKCLIQTLLEVEQKTAVYGPYSRAF